MKTQPECIVCLFRQALTTARRITADEDIHRRILVRLAQILGDVSLEQTPAHLSQAAYAVVSEITGIADPYKAAKAANNAEALRLLPKLRQIAADSGDPLRTAIHLAAAGNVIDLGFGYEFHIEHDVMAVLHQPFAIDAVDSFRRDLAPGRHLLYLGDNAGEIVFDRICIEQLAPMGVDITYAVKSGPIINDATVDDARQAGITQLVNVIETGSDDIGVYWPNASTRFIRTFETADVILSKGQGNFESCASRPENIYFLLKAKCDCVARELGVRLNDIVFKHHNTGVHP